MKEKLITRIEEIKKLKKSNTQKALDLIILAELAYQKGDMNSYSFIVNEAMILNPHFEPKTKYSNFRFKISNSPLPDIDFD